MDPSFNSAKSAGYRDVVINMRLVDPLSCYLGCNTHLVELQLIPAPIFEIKVCAPASPSLSHSLSPCLSIISLSIYPSLCKCSLACRLGCMQHMVKPRSRVCNTTATRLRIWVSVVGFVEIYHQRDAGAQLDTSGLNLSPA